jgi:hypothetical protein
MDRVGTRKSDSVCAWSRMAPCSAARLALPIVTRLGAREVRRVEKLALKRPRDPMHRALADLARLALRLELGSDLLEELRPALLIERLGQAP